MRFPSISSSCKNTVPPFDGFGNTVVLLMIPILAFIDRLELLPALLELLGTVQINFDHGPMVVRLHIIGFLLPAELTFFPLLPRKTTVLVLSSSQLNFSVWPMVLLLQVIRFIPFSALTYLLLLPLRAIFPSPASTTLNFSQSPAVVLKQVMAFEPFSELT